MMRQVVEGPTNTFDESSIEIDRSTNSLGKGWVGMSSDRICPLGSFTPFYWVRKGPKVSRTQLMSTIDRDVSRKFVSTSAVSQSGGREVGVTSP